MRNLTRPSRLHGGRALLPDSAIGLERRALAAAVQGEGAGRADPGRVRGAAHPRDLREGQGKGRGESLKDGFNVDPADLPDLARRGNIIPLCREIGADLLTPVAAFLRIARGARQPFLLESVEGGEAIARYSFLGRDPAEVVRATIGGEDASGGDPLQTLRPGLARRPPIRPRH